MFVDKDTETTEYFKKLPTFQEKYKLYVQITRHFLGLRIRHFQGTIFI